MSVREKHKNKKKKTLGRLFIREMLRVFKRLLSTNRPTLYESLHVIEHSTDLFLQPAESLFVYPHRNSVFGGQIIGSAIYAAQQTLIKNFPLHSLHSYFLGPSDNSSPIYYKIKRLRDGKSFESRSVTATQDERIVFECEMSFHHQEHGNLNHQIKMPSDGVAPPEQLLSTRQRFRKLLQDPRLPEHLRCLIEFGLQSQPRIEIRHCKPRDLLHPLAEWPAKQLVWIRTVEHLPDNPHLHRAAIAYCSDRVLLTTALLPYSLNIFSPTIQTNVSLDHSMWFHDDFSFTSSLEKTPIRANEWLLYELDCPIAQNNRALTFGRIWTRDGRLIVSCAQEGLIRF